MKKTRFFALLFSLLLLLSACAAQPPAVSEPEPPAPALLLPLETETENFSDSTFHAAFDASDVVKTDSGYALRTEIFAYDLYDAVQVQMLETYESIVVCGEQIAIDAINIVEESDSGLIEINGGLGSGICLTPHGGGTYRTVTYNDYPLYYSVGTQTFEISEDVRIIDLSRHDETANATDESPYPEEAIFGYAELVTAITDKTLWNAAATTVRTENGKITEIKRIWTP